jgi:cell division protein FtsW (lipid II flippase)
MHIRAARWGEAQLLLFPALLLAAGLVSLHVASDPQRRIDPEPLVAAGVFAALIGLPWIGWRLSGMAGDEMLYPGTCLLLVVGVLIVQRLQPEIGPPGSPLAQLSSRHALYVGLSVIALFLTGRWFPFWPALRRYKYLVMFGSLGLLGATLVFGTERYGAKLWIEAGPLSIQTSEIIKLGLVLFLAAYLHEKRELLGHRLHLWRVPLPPLPALAPLGAMLAVAVGLVVVLNDLGTALLLFGITLSMFYVATGSAAYVGVALAAFGAAAWLSYQLFDRVGVRVANWIDPWADPFEAGYQQIQSDYALAAGGLLGRGLGNGQPSAIPAVHTDFALSALAEEAGILVTLGVLALYGVLLLRGVRIANRTPILYEQLVAVGLSTTIALQAAIIAGGVLRLTPLTGVTLPFVSAGGSSLVANALAIGMLLNLSHRIEQRRAAARA